MDALGRGEVPGLLALGAPEGPLGPLRLQTEQGDEQGLSVLGLGGRVVGLSMEDGALQASFGPRLFAEAHLLLVGLALWRARGHALLPALVGGLGLILAWGPALVLGDARWPNPAYQALVQALEPLRRWWWPERAAVFALAACCAFAAPAVLALRPRWRPAAVGALALLLLARGHEAGLLPLPAWSAAASPGWACLAAAPPGAVIELPYAVDQKNLYHQTLHGKPQLGGMLVGKDAFVPEGTRALLRDNALLAGVAEIAARERVRAPTIGAGDRAALAALGFRYVAVRADTFLRPRPDRDGGLQVESDWGRGRRLLVPLLGEPAWEDEALALWTLDGAALPCAP
jgi:hypothetical protein